MMDFTRQLPHVPAAEALLGVARFEFSVLQVAGVICLALVALAYCLVRTVRQRQLAESNLRAGEAKMRGILDSASDGFIAMSGDGLVTAWNAAAVTMFGWTADEAIGRRLSQLIIPRREWPAHEAGLRRFAMTGESSVVGQRSQVKAMRRDGSTFPVELAVWEVQDGDLRTFIAFIQDITERKQHESELAQARDEALEGSRLKSEFLANMSHEIRTPLNGVIGMASLLLETDLDDAQRNGAETVLRSGESLLEILDGILDFSNIEAGRIDLDAVEFDVLHLLEDTTALLAASAGDKALALGVHVHRDVPSCVSGDPRRIRQVITNLLSNAIKFTDHGEVVVEVGVEPGEAGPAAHDDLTLRIEVMDTGIGVAREHQLRIFSSFTQADSSTTRAHGGTGLGLATAQKLVELMGGRIGVRSAVGRGSTFWFTVPVGSPHPREQFAQRARRHEDSTRGFEVARHDVVDVVRYTGRVLVAEDNPINQRVALGMLESLGYEVHVADNGRDAVAAATAIEFDLIFMDCQMPVMDGYSATALLRSAEAPGRHTPVVALTASAMQQDRQRCLDAGMDDHLAKPVRKNELAAILARFGAGAPRPALPLSLAGSSTSPDTAAAIRARLDDVYEGFGEDTGADRIELLESFLRRAAVEMDEIDAAAEVHDLATLSSRAHSVKGMAANIGADHVAAAAAAIEDAARDGRVTAVPASVAILRQAIAAAEGLIGDLVSTLVPRG